MGVNDQWGYAIECRCADQDPRRGRGRKSDHGRTLGSVLLGEGGKPFILPATNIAQADDRWNARVEVAEGGAVRALDFRLRCDRCERSWVFTTDELAQRHDVLSRRHPPVGVAGVDVGSDEAV